MTTIRNVTLAVLFQSVLTLILVKTSLAAHVANLNDSRHATESVTNLTWFIQISDLHISHISDLDRVDQLLQFSKKTLPLVNPCAVLVTGDLTDAKAADYSGSGQSIREWDMYRVLVDESLKRSLWFDIPGNHDRFDVESRSSQDHFHLEQQRRMIQQGVNIQRKGKQTLFKMESLGVRLAFIGVDATPNQGLKRPFNFIGHLMENDLSDLKALSESAKVWTDNVVWFGHYPTSSLVSASSGLREIGKDGLVYLCGHLHSLYGAVRDMFAIHSTGLVEAELEDWKFGRMIRVLAVDDGHLVFNDFKHDTWPIVLVTWPPRIGRNFAPRNGSHVRMLIFSPQPVHKVSMSIDSGPVQDCVQEPQLQPLFILPWDQGLYQSVHTIQIKVMFEDGSSSDHQHRFSVTSVGETDIFDLGSVVLRIDLSSVFKLAFTLSVCVCVCPLVLLRLTRVKCWPVLERYHLLCSMDELYFPLVVYPIYLLVGPWCAAEVMTDRLGIIFTWGILVSDGGLQFLYLPADTTWLYATVHLASVHFPVILLVANILEEKCNTKKRITSSNMFSNLIFIHLPLLLHVCFQYYLVNAFYLAYGIPTMFGPMRMGELLLTVFLWYKASHLKAEELIAVSKMFSEHQE